MSSFTNFIGQTTNDLVTLILPKRNFRNVYRFAFLVHPRDKADMIKRFAFLKWLPSWTLLGIQHYFWPVTVSKITGLRSLKNSNEEIEGYVISIPMTATEMLKNRVRAKKQIRKAVHLARNKGAKIVGLGALTSSLSRGGLDLTDISGISITTGHAYTGHNVVQTLLTQFDSIDIEYRKDTCPIAIVGAAGSIGSVAAEILAQRGVQNLYLIDIDRKLEKVKNLRDKLTIAYPKLKIQCSKDMSLLKNAIGIITATNTPDALIKSEHVATGTVIVDDAQPSDISPELYDRDDILVLEAGAVHTPDISSNFNMGLAERNDNFCCLAEVLILAANQHEHNFVINRATLKDVSHISKGGAELGFTLAKPQNEKGLVSAEHISNVAELARKRCHV